MVIGGADDYLFGRPTSDDTIYEWENPNVDRSKNTALIPPGFGTPTSYLPNSGEYLTPNLVPGALSGGLVNQVSSVGNPDGGTSVDATGSYPADSTSVSVDSSGFPTVSGSASTGGQIVAFTEVTSDLYYSSGSLGTLKIPSIGLTVGIYEGTGSAVQVESNRPYTGNGPAASGFSTPPVQQATTVPTEETVQAALSTLRERYPNGATWPAPYRSTSGGPYGSSASNCAGWAILCSNAAFGDLPWRRVDNPSWDQIRAGDLVEYTKKHWNGWGFKAS